MTKPPSVACFSRPPLTEQAYRSKGGGQPPLTPTPLSSVCSLLWVLFPALQFSMLHEWGRQRPGRGSTPLALGNLEGCLCVLGRSISKRPKAPKASHQFRHSQEVGECQEESAGERKRVNRAQLEAEACWAGKGLHICGQYSPNQFLQRVTHRLKLRSHKATEVLLVAAVQLQRETGRRWRVT